MLAFILDLSKQVLKLLYLPLAGLLCAWFLVWLLGQLSGTAHEVFSSFCFLPVVSWAAVCKSGLEPVVFSKSISQETRWADFPTLMAIQDTTMAQLLDENSSGSALALHILKAKMATTDLATLVRHSDMKSRIRLAEHLEQFAKDAETASQSLTDLSAQVFGSVDRVLGVNNFVLKSIEAARSAPVSIISVLNLWQSTEPPCIVESFGTSMTYLSHTIRTLVIALEINVVQLNHLEQQLDTLHQLVLMEGVSIGEAKSELLGSLWTFLGGNKRQLAVYESNLLLLLNVGEYRRQALAHVVSALQRLRQMNADMEDLRRRVAEPDLIPGLPVEVHIASIQRSVERLKESQVEAHARHQAVLREALSE
ncbi:hypothetical protein R3P38DRAFT_2551550 [Favolaschia claudopus]|uniref:Uncharacterized protein n=1 Tax=Favolaschia claudopus TaxID=2862362 RepID=A0AAW0AGD9_9AGAR